MEKRSLIMYGAVILIGFAVLIGTIVWLRSRDVGEASGRALHMQNATSAPSGTSKVLGKPKIRPYTKIENQPKAQPYTPDTPIHEDVPEDVLPPQQVTPQ